MKLSCAFRRGLILSALFLAAVSDGYIIGQMSAMVAAQQSKESDIPLNDNEISWIASTIHATCICGFALAAVVSEKIGRRKAISLLSTPIIINWIVMYYAERMIVFMISRIIIGVCFGGVISLCILSMAEYTLSDVRAFYLYGIHVGTTVGVASSHILGAIFHWRTVALLGIIPSGLSTLLPLLSVESPTWLASKGRFEECRTAFKALHGSDRNETELELLIEVEKCKQRITNGSGSKMFVVKHLMRAVRKKYFWKIALLCFFLHMYRLSMGIIMICTFILTMLHDLVDSSDILLITLPTDAFLVLGAFMSCYLVSKMKIRSLLFSSGIAATSLLIILCACLYFLPEKDMLFVWIKVSLLALYLITVTAGPHPVLESLFGEIYPLEIKTYCMFVFGTFGGFLLFISTKIALTMFSLIGYHGVFLLNAILSVICLVFFWQYLPETKGRTLQEIELYFKNGTFDNVNTLLEEENMNRLI